jgi:hypothetical protein
MSLIQLESPDVSNNRHGDFMYLLSCKRELELKMGSQVMAAADVSLWIGKCLEAAKSKTAVDLEWRVTKPGDAAPVVSPRPDRCYLVTFRCKGPAASLYCKATSLCRRSTRAIWSAKLPAELTSCSELHK